MLCIQLAHALRPRKSPYLPHGNVHFGLLLPQMVAVVISLVTCVSLPRRPAVFSDEGKPVDNQFTVSLFSRLTFAWNKSFLDIASRKIVQTDDLHRPAHQTRASAVQQSLESQLRPGGLLRSIFFAHLTTFVVQWILTSSQVILEFLPQVSLFKILSLLEMRSNGQKVSNDVWIWVLFLGLSLVFQSWVTSWAIFLSLSQLMLPIRAALNASIFCKAMRRKDVKETTPVKDAAVEDTSSTATPDTENQIENKQPAQEKNEPEAKISKSTVNLVSTDTRRVAEFGPAVRFFLDAVVGLILSVAFLLFLMGWKSILAGLVGFSLVIPLTTWSTRKYGAIQDRLMEVRDEKTGLVTEAFEGLRQIKFSALETQWLAKIAEMRARELNLLWWVVFLQQYCSNG